MSSPSVLAASDFHLSPATSNYVWAALEQMRSYAKRNDIEHTVWVGDILDQGETVHSALFMRLRSIARTWPGKLWVLVGNHDQFGMRWEDTVLTALHGEAAHVVAHPQLTEIGRMIPYCDPVVFVDVWAKLAEGMKQRDDIFDRIVWAHSGFKGAYRNQLSVDRDGVALRSLPLKGELIISGHYHLPQVVGRVIYCGSPYEVSFAEEGQRKGFLVLRSGERYPERVPFDDLGAPRHITVQWDPETPLVVPEIRSHDIVRVKAAVTKEVGTRAIEQLKAVGLEGAAIAYQPAGAGGVSERVRISTSNPRQAASEFVEQFVPAIEAEMWAEEKLWPTS